MKRYLLLLTSMELGGAEKQAINFAQYLKRRGYQVIVMGLTDKGKVYEIGEKSGIECISINSLKRELSIFKILYKLIAKLEKDTWVSGLCMSRAIAYYVKKNQIDIGVSYCSPANTILGLAKKFYPKCKYVWYQRDAGLCDEPKKYREEALKLVDHIWANGKSGFEWLRKTHNVNAQIIYNGVELTKPQYNKAQWLKRLEVDERACICTMIANLSSNKNHMDILKAWKYMCDHNQRENLILVFAGRYDDQFENLFRYAEQNNLLQFVRFLGMIDDVSGLLQVTSIGVFGAISEGNPNGIIEPMLCKLPIVATDLPEIRETVDESNYDLLFQAGDEKAISERLVNLSKNNELRDYIGQKNFQKAERLFSKEKNFSKMIDILEND